jgi:transcriptional regulator with XRE-family HTH domain
MIFLDLPSVSGAVLRYARKALGLTQVALAPCLGVKPETVSRWEADAAIPRGVQLAMVGLLTAVEHGLMDMVKLQETAGKPPAEPPVELEALKGRGCEAA